MLCTARRNSIALVTVLLATLTNSAVQAGTPALLDAIRSGDVQSISAALRSGADSNTRDETGATALMHAVIYASRECVRLLLDRGADVNAASGYGSTALMWGAGNPAVLQLLLNRGAAVNAQASDGTTALLVAARYGNAESMRLLLNRRADPQTSSTAREQLLRIAYSNPDPTMLRMLERAGLRLTDVSQLPGPIVSPNVSQPAVIQRFLALGASPHEEATTATVTLPALSYAAGQGAAASVALLLDHGADPNAKGSRGLTPLMMAAATDDTAKSAEVLLARHANSPSQGQPARPSNELSRNYSRPVRHSTGVRNASRATTRACRPSRSNWPTTGAYPSMSDSRLIQRRRRSPNGRTIESATCWRSSPRAEVGPPLSEM